MNKDSKCDILRLKQEGKGYKTISRLTGVNINTVKSLCRRSGLFQDNPEHKRLFTIPERQYSTAVSVPKPLPPQRVITGHKQTDAYLWILEVIKLNEPAHLPAAEEALTRLTITPKEAQEKYTEYLISHGVNSFQLVFSTMTLDNPQHFIDQAKAQFIQAAEVRAVFGSYEAAYYEFTEPEKRLEDTLGYLYDNCFGWTKAEKKRGSIQGKRVNEVDELRQKEAFKVMKDILPEPYTLSDVVREFQYWDWRYRMRSAAGKEIAPNAFGDGEGPIYARESWLEKKLEIIHPRTRQEAINVLKWYIDFPRFEDGNGDNVYLNLIGQHQVE